jgi:hypothetical protein
MACAAAAPSGLLPTCAAAAAAAVAGAAPTLALDLGASACHAAMGGAYKLQPEPRNGAPQWTGPGGAALHWDPSDSSCGCPAWRIDHDRSRLEMDFMTPAEGLPIPEPHMYIATIVWARLIEHLAQSECSLRYGFDTNWSLQGRPSQN